MSPQRQRGHPSLHGSLSVVEGVEVTGGRVPRRAWALATEEPTQAGDAAHAVRGAGLWSLAGRHAGAAGAAGSGCAQPVGRDPWSWTRPAISLHPSERPAAGPRCCGRGLHPRTRAVVWTGLEPMETRVVLDLAASWTAADVCLPLGSRPWVCGWLLFILW